MNAHAYADSAFFLPAFCVHELYTNRYEANLYRFSPTRFACSCGIASCFFLLSSPLLQKTSSLNIICFHLYVFSSLDACASTRLFVDAVFNMSPNRKDTHLLGCKRYNAFFLVTRISSSSSVEVLGLEGASSKDNSSGKWQPLRQHTLL